MENQTAQSTWKNIYECFRLLSEEDPRAFRRLINNLGKQEWEHFSKIAKDNGWNMVDPNIIILPDTGFTSELIGDLITTALEGGSNYWYFISDVTYDVSKQYSKSKYLAERIWDTVQQGVELPINDVENPKDQLGILSMRSIADAIAIMENKFPDAFSNCVNGDFDADDADIFFQLAVMGELTFG